MTKLACAALAALFLTAACSKDKDVIQKPGPTQEAAKGAPAAQAPAPAITGRRIDIQVSNAGYKPDQIDVKAGEDVTLVFTMVEETECGSEVQIPSTQAHAKLALNVPTPLPFKADKPGPVAFTCGMGMMKGTLVVN